MLPDLEDYDGDLTKKKRPPKKKALSDIILLTSTSYGPFLEDRLIRLIVLYPIRLSSSEVSFS
jgi:hypothetical protein